MAERRDEMVAAQYFAAVAGMAAMRHCITSPSTVRERLEAANPQQAGDVPTAVREATRRASTAPSAVTRETAIAHALVKSLYEDGRLDEHQVTKFAEAGKFDEANASIAALANVSVSIAENMMIEARAEGVMILAKVWGPEYQGQDNYVRLYVTYLRKKIEPDPAHPKYVLTERGAGYRFVDFEGKKALPRGLPS